MASKPCLLRLQKEYQRLNKEPVPNISAEPRPNNILEWHFVINGPASTPYAGGQYHGKLLFPSDYPYKPPAIMMLTPNGRFNTNTRLCLSMSDFHPESWVPAWSVGTILNGVLSFMLESTPTVGSVEKSTAERQQAARAARTSPHLPRPAPRSSEVARRGTEIRPSPSLVPPAHSQPLSHTTIPHRTQPALSLPSPRSQPSAPSHTASPQPALSTQPALSPIAHSQPSACPLHAASPQPHRTQPALRLPRATRAARESEPARTSPRLSLHRASRASLAPHALPLRLTRPLASPRASHFTTPLTDSRPPRPAACARVSRLQPEDGARRSLRSSRDLAEVWPRSSRDQPRSGRDLAEV